MSQPAARFNIGFITATVWQNTSRRDNTFYTVEVSRTYKEGDDYKQTNTLMHSDLLNAARVLQRAEEWINRQT